MNRPEPAHLQKPRNAFGVAPVCFDRHRLQRALHLPGAHQYSCKARLAQALVKPLRKWSRFKANSDQALRQVLQKPDQRVRFAKYLRLSHNLSLLGHKAAAVLVRETSNPINSSMSLPFLYFEEPDCV